MHYKNGREAKVGDKVIIPRGNDSFIGVVVELLPGAETCNLYAVPLRDVQLADSCKDCVHLEDALSVSEPEAESANNF